MNGPIVHDLETWVKDVNRRVELLERRRIGRAGTSGGGTSDHGGLSGLGDDDHFQYHTDGRGDARYSKLGHHHDAAYLSPSEVIGGTNVTVDNSTLPGSVIINSSGGGGVAAEHEVVVSGTMPTDPLNELWVNTAENPTQTPSRVLLPTSGNITPGSVPNTYYVVLASDALTVTMPTAVNNTTTTYVIKRTGMGTVTVATTGSQTIDGSSILTLTVQWQSYTLASDGANWVIV